MDRLCWCSYWCASYGSDGVIAAVLLESYWCSCILTTGSVIEYYEHFLYTRCCQVLDVQYYLVQLYQYLYRTHSRILVERRNGQGVAYLVLYRTYIPDSSTRRHLAVLEYTPLATIVRPPQDEQHQSTHIF